MSFAIILLVQVSWQEGFTRLHEFLYCFDQSVHLKPYHLLDYVISFIE